MSYDATKPWTIRWSCDHDGCNATDLVAFEEHPQKVQHLLPPEWCAVLITSMSDGDYGYHLCPEHTSALHATFKDDVNLSANNSAVGR